MIGPAFSGESKAADKIFEEGKVPNLTPSATNPDLSKQGYKFFHRMVATDAAQGAGIADFMITAKSPKKAYVINGKKAYSVGLGDSVFADLQGRASTSSATRSTAGATTTPRRSRRSRPSHPDVIFFGGYYSAGRRAAQAAP